MREVIIRTMSSDDGVAVQSIYAEGISTGNATFESDVPEWQTWDRNHLKSSCIVALVGGVIVGWAALSPVSARQVYKGVAEVSVYVGKNSQGTGIGKALLQRLIELSEENGVWTLQASVFPENEASINLHLRCGFRQVGYRERVGSQNGVWRNTILLERRSKSVGV